MITVRFLTAEEQEALAQRLENLSEIVVHDYTRNGYAPQLEYMISGLKHHAPLNVVEEEGGRAVRYSLEFASPRETWTRRCGRSGFCTLHADSLRFIHCSTLSMS